MFNENMEDKQNGSKKESASVVQQAFMAKRPPQIIAARNAPKEATNTG